MGSGPTEAFLWPVAGLSLAAAVSDLWRGRIYNWLTLPMIVAGFAFSCAKGGWAGAGASLAGAILGLALYGWMFWVGHLGGGDVKLLMALGAWGGPRYCADVAVLSIVLGGLMAIALLAWKGALFGTLSKLFRFVRSVAVPGLELELPQADRRHTMPYGVPIAAAAVWVAWADPLQAWGLRPW